jgi:hypothetical protein
MTIIGQKLEIVNYLTTLDGYDNYSGDSKADFDYLPIGGLHFRLSNGISYCIADYNTTKLATNGVGLKEIGNKQTDLTKNNISKVIKHKWTNYIGQTIRDILFYIKTEEWTNYSHNEEYPESLEILFDNGKSVFYFCGDVDEYSETKGRYELLGGRDSGILFFDKETFIKYGLDKVEKIEKITGYYK